MANSMSWREAWDIAWGRLTGVDNEGSSAGVRLLFFLLFILGTGWAGFRYYEMQRLREEKDFFPSVAPQSVEADKKRLDDMIEQVRAATALRANSFVWAQSMKELGKHIFDEPTQMALVPGEGLTSPVVPIVENPPNIVVRAIMILGKNKTAVMDIAGVGSGLIVRQGDTFMGRKGRIVRIAADKVVVRWANKNWDVAPGF